MNDNVVHAKFGENLSILHVITGLDTGGAELLLKRYLYANKGAQSKHVIVSLGSLGPIGEDLRSNDFIVHSLNLTKVWDAPMALFKLIKLIKRHKPDVVHTWLYHADILGGFAAKLTGVKCVIWGIHSTDVAGFTTSVVQKACAIFSYVIPSTIVCIAEVSRQKHVSIGYCEKKIKLFCNGLDFSCLQVSKEQRDSFRLKHNIKESDIVIGSLGRFHWMKGYDLFISAAAQLIHEFPHVRILIIGRGLTAENADLMVWINKTGFADRFILLGERSDVAICLSSMDVFCLHSRSEGLPTVLIEAMAMALPCVSTDVGDAGRLLANTGLLVEKKNAIALANGLKQMLTMCKEERSSLGKRASERARAQFTIEQTSMDFSCAYAEVMSKVKRKTINHLQNVDHDVAKDFGDEWEKFDQSKLLSQERKAIFDSYFALFPWGSIDSNAIGFDAGCGSGRWAALVAPLVAHIHCIDPSNAIEVAQRNLQHHANCSFHRATVSDMPFPDGSMDFGYSLGVLHHIPNTQKGINDCVKKLKPGAPFLIYLYYALENQPTWFRWLWKCSDIARTTISNLSFKKKYYCSQIIATFIYFPLARIAFGLDKLGVSVHSFPLSTYRDKSFYVMRTDALDRFGTKLEKRFTADQILDMMAFAGLERIAISTERPFWCAIGFKKDDNK